MVSPTIRSPRVAVAPQYQREARTTRRPQHKFNLRTYAYDIQPFMIAPVLPGETLQNIMLQAQCWSDPLHTEMKNIGWWKEYYFFYVKHRDLAGFEVATDGLGKDLLDMFVTAESIASHQDADGNVYTYCSAGAVDFTLECVKRITEEYFRDEGEAWDESTNATTGLPKASRHVRGRRDWSARMTLDADYEDRRVDLDLDADGTIYANELEQAFMEWAAMRDAGLVDMDYEDWMRTYGSRSVLPNADRVDHHRPELIAEVVDFTYPTNTVEPSTGAPSVAVGWRTAKRSNSRKRFAEPGWIIGITIQRPKIYMKRQTGAIAGFMQTRNTWIPAILNDQMDVSHLQFAAGEGPVPTVGGVGTEAAYWMDLRDLLNHGDQFVNYAITGVKPAADMPYEALERKYAGDAFIDSLYATTGGLFREDGIVSLGILGHQRDVSKNLVLGQG